MQCNEENGITGNIDEKVMISSSSEDESEYYIIKENDTPFQAKFIVDSYYNRSISGSEVNRLCDILLSLANWLDCRERDEYFFCLLDIYLKFRHDIFAFICMITLDTSADKLGTDFEYKGKTPDFKFKERIFEVSVVHSKKSYNSKINKYDFECNYLIYMFSDNNLEQINETLGKAISYDLTTFNLICNHYHKRFKGDMPYLFYDSSIASYFIDECKDLMSQVRESSGEIKNSFSFQFERVPHSVMISMVSNWSRLERLCDVSKRRMISVIFDIKKKRWSLNDNFRNKISKSSIYGASSHGNLVSVIKEFYVKLSGGIKLVKNMSFNNSTICDEVDNFKFHRSKRAFIAYANVDYSRCTVEGVMVINNRYKDISSIFNISFPKWNMMRLKECELSCKQNKMTNLISEAIVNEKMIKKGINSLRSKMSNPDYKHNPAQTFTFPIIEHTMASTCSRDQLDFDKDIIRILNDPITTAVFDRMGSNFKMGVTKVNYRSYPNNIRSMIEESRVVSEEIYIMKRQISKDIKAGKLSELKKKSKRLNVKIRSNLSKHKSLSGFKGSSRVRINKKIFRETTHLNNSKLKDPNFMYKIKGYVFKESELDGNIDRKVHNYSDIISSLLEDSPLEEDDNPFEMKSDFKYGDDIMGKLKGEMEIKRRDILKKLCTISLFKVLKFIGSLCREMCYHTTENLKSGEISISNLGYKDTLLMVYGGTNSYKISNSRFFRLIYPASKHIKPHISKRSRFFSYKGKRLFDTGWMSYNVKVFIDNIFIVDKAFNYLSCMSLKSNRNPDKTVFRKYMFPILLMLDNHRKLESTLHSLRYIIANCMAEYSRVDLMLPALYEKPINNLHAYIYMMLIKNMPNYYKDCKSGNVKHLFDPEVDLSGGHDIASLIYSTYLMTKAPINQSMEQALNLKKVMEIDKEFRDLVKGDDFTSINRSNDIRNDFGYDSRFCYTIGKYLSHHMIANGHKDNLAGEWAKIKGLPWDVISNSRGLRGDEEDFFNRKGHEICYKEILKNPQSHDRKRLVEMAKDLKPDTLRFHVVDKEQRGGGREIYVMDFKTKLSQQLLEKFFSKVCKKIPNEIISVPSNKRLGLIHSKVFENRTSDKTYSNYYLSLDCRKWAPKSNLNKYVLFLLGMSEIMPPDFMILFFGFFNMMYGKKVYTREHAVKNAGQEVKDWLKFDEKRKGYYFKMPYSFVMGIFNYLSSLMHVANQMYASYYFFNTRINMARRPVILNMLAHSDDSGGVVQVPLGDDISMVLREYQILLKMSNHMISLKKSNVSKNYLELLSVLYINEELVPLIPKFAAQNPIKIDGYGIVSDFNSLISKVIEMIGYGSTFLEAYIILKNSGYSICEFYNIKRITTVPLSLLGSPDCHPIYYMLMGTDADLYRIYRTKGLKWYRSCLLLSHELNKGEVDVELLKSPDINYHKSKLSKRLEAVRDDIVRCKEYECYKDSWMTKKLKSNNPLLNMVWFGNQLFKKEFIDSMSQVSPLKRLLRLYPLRGSECIWCGNSYVTLKEYQDTVMNHLTGTSAILFKDNPMSNLETILSRLFLWYNDLNCYLNKEMDNVIIKKSYHSCKPITVQFSNLDDDIKYPIQDMMESYFKGPLDTLVSDSVKHYTENLIREENLLGMTPDFVFAYLTRLKKKANTTYYIYSYVESDKRIIRGGNSLKDWLSSASFPNSKVSLPIADVVQDTIGLDANRDFKTIMSYSVLKIFSPIADKLEWNIKGKPVKGEDIKGESLNWIYPNDKKNVRCYNYWRVRQFHRSDGSWRGYGCLIVILNSMEIMIEMMDSDIEYVTIYSNRTNTMSDFETWYFKSNVLGMLRYTKQYSGDVDSTFPVLGCDRHSDRISLLKASNSRYYYFRVAETESRFAECKILEYKPYNGDVKVKDNQDVYFGSYYKPFNYLKNDDIADCIKPTENNKAIIKGLSRGSFVKNILNSVDVGMSKSIESKELFRRYCSSRHFKIFFNKKFRDDIKYGYYEALKDKKRESKEFGFEVEIDDLDDYNLRYFDLRELPPSVLAQIGNVYEKCLTGQNYSLFCKNLNSVLSRHAKATDINRFLHDWGDRAFNMGVIIAEKYNVELKKVILNPFMVGRKYCKNMFTKLIADINDIIVSCYTYIWEGLDDVTKNMLGNKAAVKNIVSDMKKMSISNNLGTIRNDLSESNIMMSYFKKSLDVISNDDYMLGLLGSKISTNHLAKSSGLTIDEIYSLYGMYIAGNRPNMRILQRPNFCNKTSRLETPIQTTHAEIFDEKAHYGVYHGIFNQSLNRFFSRMRKVNIDRLKCIAYPYDLYAYKEECYPLDLDDYDDDFKEMALELECELAGSNPDMEYLKDIKKSMSESPRDNHNDFPVLIMPNIRNKKHCWCEILALSKNLLVITSEGLPALEGRYYKCGMVNKNMTKNNMPTLAWYAIGEKKMVKLFCKRNRSVLSKMPIPKSEPVYFEGNDISDMDMRVLAFKHAETVKALEEAASDNNNNEVEDDKGMKELKDRMTNLGLILDPNFDEIMKGVDSKKLIKWLDTVMPSRIEKKLDMVESLRSILKTIDLQKYLKREAMFKGIGVTGKLGNMLTGFRDGRNIANNMLTDPELRAELLSKSKVTIENTVRNRFPIDKYYSKEFRFALPTFKASLKLEYNRDDAAFYHDIKKQIGFSFVVPNLTPEEKNHWECQLEHMKEVSSEKFRREDERNDIEVPFPGEFEGRLDYRTVFD